jgi:hypothetical protein
MSGASWTFVRRWSRTVHRDIGFFLTAFVRMWHDAVVEFMAS